MHSQPEYLLKSQRDLWLPIKASVSFCYCARSILRSLSNLQSMSMSVFWIFKLTVKLSINITGHFLVQVTIRITAKLTVYRIFNIPAKVTVKLTFNFTVNTPVKDTVNILVKYLVIGITTIPVGITQGHCQTYSHCH